MWIAFHWDWSAFAVFDDELACYRYAVNNHMEVRKFKTGQDIPEQLQGVQGAIER